MHYFYFVTFQDFTFWLRLRLKAELKLNLRAQLWSQPGLRIKFWLNPWAERNFVHFTCLQSSARLLTEYWHTETYFI